MQKIPSWVFELYKSTKTGIFTDTKNGIPWWRNKKIWFLGFVAFVSFSICAFTLPDTIKRHYGKNNDEDKQGSVSHQKGQKRKPKVLSFNGLQSPKIYFVGSVKNMDKERIYFNVISSDEKKGTVVDDLMLRALGYELLKVTTNVIFLKKDRQLVIVKKQGKENEGKIL